MQDFHHDREEWSKQWANSRASEADEMVDQALKQWDNEIKMARPLVTNWDMNPQLRQESRQWFQTRVEAANLHFLSRLSLAERVREGINEDEIDD